ncbi:Pimeloyl-ACP methyl ester carboxylesterase [Tindallia magadiensis]|uniref:Pimeloyl-ACP methyl ester carboxylesterase n=1 Tax=Tindallia magadiensis TaxID=69895 RepID=A0A1I3FRX6_9FIRM|nr:alpha/beta hydrolase [Tindallia magadiensis]SFI13993.1 Pimeloyl-ACP methyl ester carboxylesterase [Tindallia magadiensis]
MKIQIQGSGVPVVMIHQIGSSSDVWKFQREELASSYQIISVDLYGHGSCPSRNEVVSINETVKMLSEKLTEMGVNGAVMIGHGLGGIIATEIAFHDRLKVARLIVIDMFPKRKDLKLIRQLDLEQLERNRTAVIQAHYKQLIEDPDLREAVVKEALRTDEKAYYFYMKDMIENDFTQKLNLLHAPVHYLYSSIAAKSKEDAKNMLDKMGVKNVQDNKLYYYSQSGHFLMLEQPRELTEDLKKVISLEEQLNY